MNYEVTIGLETHVQLDTPTKIFCSCSNDHDSEPNTNVCPVCLGYPGALPVLSNGAVRQAIKTGLMLNCEIADFSKFDRKSYFYPDMCKNYQITQFDQPICIGGYVDIEVDGKQKRIRIHHIHLEDNAAKNTHQAGFSEIDFNRAGTPLIEIVSEPDLSSAEEAVAYLSALKQILVYGGVSACNLEEGDMRCDVNTSLRPLGQVELGTRTELKNMNTFKGIAAALKSEIRRQGKQLDKGEAIRQETMRFDPDTGLTSPMRSKEYAHDYRYFPEPDLPPIEPTAEFIEALRSELPELPAARHARLVTEYGLPEYDAGVLVADKAIADYYEAVVKASGEAKAASNWVMTEVLRVLSEEGGDVSDFRVSADQLGAVIKLAAAKTVSSSGAKKIFAVLLEEGGDPKAIMEREGLAQVSDSGAMGGFVDQAIEANAKSVEEYKGGKVQALQFLVGQVMRFSKGKANPQLAMQLLKEKLDA